MNWWIAIIVYGAMAALLSGLRLAVVDNVKATLPAWLGGGVIRSKIAVWPWLSLLQAFWVWPTSIISGILKVFGRRGFLDENGCYQVSSKGFQRQL